MTQDEHVVLEILKWHGFDIVSLNDYRVAGPKPLGGAEIVAEFRIARSELLKALTDYKFVFCSSCGEIRPFSVRPNNDTTADMHCDKCRLVIATLYKEQE